MKSSILRLFSLCLVLAVITAVFAPVCGSEVEPLYSFGDETPAEIRVGDSVYFGRYEQDNVSSQKEDIEWTVLEIRDDKALIFSKYVLDAIPYHRKNESVTWADSSIRQWLNGTFLNAAFSDSEQRSILSVTEENPSNDEYHIPGGEATRDQVFLLSYDDATTYFWGNSERQACPTQYALSHNVFFDEETACSWWWLRSPGKTANRAGNVVARGIPSTYGGFVNSGDGGVRPALWVQKDALKTSAGNPYTGALTTPYGIVTEGSVIRFGRYEQDDVFSNGKEAIEWIVLDVQDDWALLISKYCLDAQPYNQEFTDVTWETCSLRQWLNTTFLKAAFSQEELQHIALTTITTPDNTQYGTSGGNPTRDRVFVITTQEASSYFPNFASRRAAATQYAINQTPISPDEDNLTEDGEESCWWRLRNPGMGQNYAARVLSTGQVYEMGDIVHYVNGGIRPSIWLNLK